MTNDEYKEFLKYIFNEYIRSRIYRMEHLFDHPHQFEYWNYQLLRLKRAVGLINYINDYSSGDSSTIYGTFTLSGLRGTISIIREGVNHNNYRAEETGFLDALDSYYDEIVEGLAIELFPESEYDLLREFGSRDPRSDIQGIIYLLKARKRRGYCSNKEVSISKRLKDVVEKLSEYEEHFKEQDEKKTLKEERPKKSRRWWKGLGQIGRGAALSIGDMALAIGVLHFPVSPETQTWGSLVSATTGVGMIRNGIGELRNE